MNDDSVLALGDIVLLHLHYAALPHLPLFSSLWLSVAHDKCLPGASELAYDTHDAVMKSSTKTSSSRYEVLVPLDVLCHIISPPANVAPG